MYTLKVLYLNIFMYEMIYVVQLVLDYIQIKKILINHIQKLKLFQVDKLLNLM